MKFKIGVDGGGTKTECVLVNQEGIVVAVHVGAGCNPSIVGPAQARSIVTAALDSLRAQAATNGGGATRAPFREAPEITATLLCMAGSGGFWGEFAASLSGFGRIMALDDSLPVLELATHGQPGLVLHAGTGSFVAARAPDGSVHYAGGLGWRFGDPGSGYDLGRRAIARALLEFQGWAPASRLGLMVRAHAHFDDTVDAGAVTRYYYQHPEINHQIADLAPAILQLAGEGEPAAQQLVFKSTAKLLDLATQVAGKLFPAVLPGTVRTGLSGPILIHPVVMEALAARTPLPLAPVEGKPIEGVRRLLEKY
jgi:N-acetylglucosamine kinase-like BadF-type ATPase